MTCFRIISQDKTFDMPYNKHSLYIVENGTELIGIKTDNGHIIADYSSKEKAIQVLNDLRTAYKLYANWFYGNKTTPQPDPWFIMPHDKNI